MIELDPPGTLCQNRVVLDIARQSKARCFYEVGVGTGSLSLALCRRGLRGVGVEYSPAAAAAARRRLERDIRSGAFRLVEGDFLALEPPQKSFDLSISMMVIEHIKDDVAFARRLASVVRPGGSVVIGVPARMDRWGVEDKAAGHFRRYERDGLRQVLVNAGLVDIEVLSASVPAANVTFHLSNFLIGRSGVAQKLSLPQEERTKLSGLHDVPLKTMFPPLFKLLLNPVAMYPLFVLQRAFYRTGLGLTLVACGRQPGTK
jgi:SAM-dependent methyltransferase